MVFPISTLTQGPAMYHMRKYVGPTRPELKEEHELKQKEHKRSQIINGIVWLAICLGAMAILTIAYWDQEGVSKADIFIACLCVIPICALPWLFVSMLLELFND